MNEPNIVSYSELSTARQCALKHQLSYVERWTKEPEKDSALTKGTAWHAVLEAHYLTIKRHQELARNGFATPPGRLLGECSLRVETLLEEVDTDLADLVWWMYRGFIDQYGTDDQWKILAVEHAAQCRLPTALGRPSGFILKMKIDLIVADITRAKPQVWIVDHKSGKNLPKGKELDLDDQFGLYTWGLRSMGKKVFGQIHDAARTQRNQADHEEFLEDWDARNKLGKTKGKRPEPQTLDDRFLRTPMSRSDIELSTLAVEAYRAMRQRYREQREIEQQNAQYGGLTTRFESPRSTDPDTCKWKCNFLEPCLAARRGIELRQFLRDKGFEQNFERH